MTKYFYLKDGKKIGPLTKKELSKENLTRNTKIWYYGIDDWTEIKKIPDLKEVTNSIPPEIVKKKSIIAPATVKSDKIPEKNQSFKADKTQQSNLGIRKKNNAKWIILIISLVIFSIVIYFNSQSKISNDEYEKISNNSYSGNEDFQVYVDKFYRDLSLYGIYPKKPKNIIIKFSKLDKIENTTHVHGLSFGYDNDDEIEIYINPSSWKDFNKAKRHYLIYHELCHDVLNIDDLEALPKNEGKLMYPSISTYEDINMDDFIESYHTLFEEYSENNY